MTATGPEDVYLHSLQDAHLDRAPEISKLNFGIVLSVYQTRIMAMQLKLNKTKIFKYPSCNLLTAVGTGSAVQIVIFHLFEKHEC